MKQWDLFRKVVRRPPESCLTYAPWRGHFGVHYTMKAGTVHRWWGNNPIKWWEVYTTIKLGDKVKAAFLYFRLTKDRPAIVLDTYIRKEPGVRYVKGDAQQ